MKRACVKLLGIALLVLTSCAAGTTSIGPLTMDIPEGWQVTDREGNNLKLTDGTIADPTATKAGTATAVFDIYVDSPLTPDAYVKQLRDQKVEAKRERTEIDGYAAEIISYDSSRYGGRQEAIFVPRRKVFILYRAAFRNDDDAFLRGRAAFRRAVRSITFSGAASSA